MIISGTWWSINAKCFLLFVRIGCLDPSQQNVNTIVELNLRALTKFVQSSDNYRLIETIFSNFNLFPQTNFSNETNVDSPSLIGVPISYQIANLSEIQTDEDIIRYRIRVPKVREVSCWSSFTDLVEFWFHQMQRPKNISCVYWSFEENNGSWISDGRCRFLGYANDYAQCSCNHLTHFALLMVCQIMTTIDVQWLCSFSYLKVKQRCRNYLKLKNFFSRSLRTLVLAYRYWVFSSRWLLTFCFGSFEEEEKICVDRIRWNFSFLF